MPPHVALLGVIPNEVRISYGYLYSNPMPPQLPYWGVIPNEVRISYGYLYSLEYHIIE